MVFFYISVKQHCCVNIAEAWWGSKLLHLWDGAGGKKKPEIKIVIEEWCDEAVIFCDLQADLKKLESASN